MPEPSWQAVNSHGGLPGNELLCVALQFLRVAILSMLGAINKYTKEMQTEAGEGSFASYNSTGQAKSTAQ